VNKRNRETLTSSGLRGLKMWSSDLSTDGGCTSGHPTTNPAAAA